MSLERETKDIHWSERVFTVPSYNLSHLLTDADVLLIVPPFANIEWPSLALHILQACAKKAGFTVNVFYANLAIAAWISEETYQLIVDTKLLGEVIFSSNAYNKKFSNPFDQIESVVIKESLIEIESKLDVWLASLTNEIFRNKYKVVGSTTSYDQINSSIAFIHYAKRINPDLITILGGANCQGDLGIGIQSLSDDIDYIFSGESEITLPKFLKDISMGIYPSEQIIHGQLCNLNDIPVPDYDNYLRQLAFFLPYSPLNIEKKYYLSYETSRGCWWGQKQRCNYCGATTEMKYREKSPEKVISDLKYITSTFQTNLIIMADLIMPYNYFNSLLPRLAKEFRNIRIFYEIKSNVTFEQLILLKKAGVYRVQPGIETLSTSLLKKMNKGVTAGQNISLLRNARTLDIKLSWVFLCKYPGDTEQEYQEILKLIPMIIHLNPPYVFSQVLLLRFSPLFDFYEKFNIKNLLPDPKYQKCFPLDSISKIAYYYTGEFNCFANLDEPLIQEIILNIKKWQELWENVEPPKLKLIKNNKNQYLLIDMRGLSEPIIQTISKNKARTILFDWHIDSDLSEIREEIDWGIEHKLFIKIDSWYISLVTTDPELIMVLKKENQFNPYQQLDISNL